MPIEFLENVVLRSLGDIIFYYIYNAGILSYENSLTQQAIFNFKK